MKTRIIGSSLAVAAFVTVAGGAAFAADAPGSAAKATLSPAEVVRKVEAAGYTNVHDLEFDDGRWELEATSPKGAHVDLDVDATSGQIVHEETD